MRAEPLPQPIHGDSLRRQRQWGAAHDPLVQAGVPPHLPDPARRGAADNDQPQAAKAPPAGDQARARQGAGRPAAGADLGHLEPTAERIAVAAPQLRGSLLPGNRYIDWVGADIYSRYTDFGGISRLCHRYARRKPFAITEFGLWGADDPGFLRHLLRWVRAHRKTRMLVYYQDFGSSNPFRIQNYPAGRAVLKHALNSHRFPPRAPNFPRP